MLFCRFVGGFFLCVFLGFLCVFLLLFFWGGGFVVFVGVFCCNVFVLFFVRLFVVVVVDFGLCFCWGGGGLFFVHLQVFFRVLR